MYDFEDFINTLGCFFVALLIIAVLSLSAFGLIAISHGFFSESNSNSDATPEQTICEACSAEIQPPQQYICENPAHQLTK